mgnify:CR=1 FL=1
MSLWIRWFDAAVVATLLFATPAWPGTLTVVIEADADQEIALTTVAGAQAAAVTLRNTEAVAWNAANPMLPPRPLTPVLTREQWLADLVKANLIAMSVAHRTKVLGSAQAAFEAATPANKAVVCAALGLSGKGLLPECP